MEMMTPARILYLEDEQTIADVTSEYMKMQGYQVTHVSDGQQAIDVLMKQVFDLLILDIMVPEMSGIDVLTQLDQKNNQPAVIMLSALDDEATQIQAFNLQADDYITKPFSPILLLKRIEAVLRRRDAVTSQQEKHHIAEQEVSNMTLYQVDTEQYQVFYNNQSLALTVTEFILFQTLYQRPTHVFTREHLLNCIFQDDYFPNDRIIDAHIKNIRKKLPVNVIKTIIGLGYQYDDSHELH